MIKRPQQVTFEPIPELWGARSPRFIEPLADVYRLVHGQTRRMEAMIAWYPAEWDDIPPPNCYYASEILADGIPAIAALDRALERSSLVILEALAGAGKTVTARALCDARPNMVYIDCADETALWRRVHEVSRANPSTVLVLDSFDDTHHGDLVTDAMRLTAMVTERGARIVIAARPFALDSIADLAAAPRVFLRSIADPVEPGWRAWLDAWNEFAPDHPLSGDEIESRQIQDLVTVPIVHQLFAVAKDLVVARYRYEDCDLLDALSCDVLEVFFSSRAVNPPGIASLPHARMRLIGEIAWALHARDHLSPDEVAAICHDVGFPVEHPPKNWLGGLIHQQDDRIRLSQRTFREYLTAWHWSARLAELHNGTTTVGDLSEALGQTSLLRPGDRCLAFLTRLTGDWQPQEHAAFVARLVSCIAQRDGEAGFRHNLLWVLSAQHRLHDHHSWTLEDTGAIRELLDECQLPISVRGLALPDANFAGVSAATSEFAHTALPRARLVDADFTAASFVEAEIKGADLSGANLQRANLRGADLSDCNLNKTDLRGADLSDALLRGADLSGVLYDGDTVWPERYHPRRSR